jgi:hypothetical protein
MTLEEIVAGLRSSNDAAVKLVSRLDEDQWQLLTPSEGWPVGMVEGRPVDPGDVDAVNARHAAQGVVAAPDEVARLIRQDGDHALAVLIALTPADVAGDVEFGGRQMPRTALLGASLRHVDSHLASIRAAVGAEGPA